MIFGLAVLFLLILIALISLVNALTFPRLQQHRLQNTLSVSLLVPARNEAGQIARTLTRLRAQKYPDFEIILLDDGSSDGTLEIAQQTSSGDTRVRVISGKPLPEGWLGKNWACHQLAQEAQGDLLVFTDADVRWEPQALSAVVSLLQRTRADMLTVWPTQQTESWSERLVVPMMMFVIMGYLPEILVRVTPWPIFAAANGQCLVFRRSAYAQIGGHEAVRNSVIEDMGLAWVIKRSGDRLVMALGDRLIQTRMYTNLGEVLDGFAKNILAGHGGQPFFLTLSAIFHWFLFFLPWVWLVSPDSYGWPWLPLTVVLLGVGIRGLSAIATRQRLQDSLLLPFSVVLMTVIAARSVWWFYRPSAHQWKGRPVSSRR